MASIIKKTINGKPYYYARESQRVNGKPKIVWQKYLGKADDIITALTEPTTPTASTPEHAVVTEFGAVVALYDLAQRLQLVEHIDHHAPKRSTGPSVGTYLLVAAINRCVAPCSKTGIADWFQNTVLRRLIHIEPRQLSSQRFWDNMHRVSGQAIMAMERDIVSAMARTFDIDLRQVLFDATNFFTFINTFNERNTVAQRGKSKEGRQSLRIVGLALLVSADGHVPLLHRTLLGKTLLFTDNDDWSNAQIVRAYRAQHHIETGFRRMKDVRHISLRPQHHWTDQKIEVHVFCCVLALLLCSLLRREAQQRGIDGSIPLLLDRLGGIREVGVVYPAADKRRAPSLHYTLSKMSDEQQALFRALSLTPYLTP